VKNRVVTATELKAKCLALLDEVDGGDSIFTVTKRGRPVAVLQPVKKIDWKSLEGALLGKLEIDGDIVNFDTSGLWEATIRTTAVKQPRPKPR
jgi:prevent-host-death family protein